MTKNEKQKKSLIRRILKWTGISFLVLLVILIIVPIIFKDKIKELVIEEANKTLTAKLELGEFFLIYLVYMFLYLFFVLIHNMLVL